MQHPQTGLDNGTRYAYRRLLYWALLDLRRIDNLVYTPAALLNPLGWRPTVQQTRQSAALADWLHNLALLSALEFEHFDEVWFWRVYERVVSRRPDLKRYKNCSIGRGPSIAHRKVLHNQPLLWTGPRRVGSLFLSSVPLASRVARHIYEQAVVKAKVNSGQSPILEIGDCPKFPGNR